MPSGTGTSTLRFIRCTVQEESYGLDMAWVRSIQRADQLKRNVGEEGCVGWLPSREENIPVYDLASRLGRVSGPLNMQGRIVILNPLTTHSKSPSSHPWALLVDRVSQVAQIPLSGLTPLPMIAAHSLSRYFRGVIQMGEEIVPFLAPEQLHPDAPPYVEPVVRQPIPAVNHLKGGTSSPASSTKRLHHEKQILLFTTTESAPDERALAFALSITQVPEILNMMPITHVPGAPSFVLGLANWRNRPIPVIDLNARLGLPPSSLPLNAHMRLLIVRSPNESGTDVFAGLVIQPKVRAVRLPMASQPCRSTLPIESRLLSGIVNLEKETVAIPDLAHVLSF